MIFKGIESCGTDNCHQMALVINEKGLEIALNHDSYKNGFLVQKLIDHDEMLLKVYVVGEKIVLAQRESLPNLSKESLDEDIIFFQSNEKFSKHKTFSKYYKGFENNIVNESVIKIIAQEISKNFQFSLFGFDLIIESGTGIYYLIDTNYLPSFREVTNFKELLHDHIIKICEEATISIVHESY